MNIRVLFIALASLILLHSCTKKNLPDEIEVPTGYSLVWSDEFNEPLLDPLKWNFELGDGTAYGLPAGWGNNELQIYTRKPENASIETDEELSVLAIRAVKNAEGDYTSAKLNTKDLKSIRFGRIDVKARMPKGKGIWPAIWMLGENRNEIDWPGCGEIDIAEVLGDNPYLLYSTLHYTDQNHKHKEIQNEYELLSGDFSDDYHLYSLSWTPEMLVFSLDEKVIQEVPIAEDMKEFLRSFYLILNVAVGGNWPGDPDGTTVFPQTLYVDYVRVFSKDGLEIPEAPALDLEEETVGQVIEPNIGDHAIKEGFTDLGNLTVVAYGGGGEPLISSSDTAIDGEQSLVFDFPGGKWGGAYLELSEAKNLSTYSSLKFSLNMPASLTNAEIKLESASTHASVFLENYSSVENSNGFVDYTIPLADFTGLDLSGLKIPFSIWNPVEQGGGFVRATVLIDQVYFSN